MTIGLIQVGSEKKKHLVAFKNHDISRSKLKQIKKKHKRLHWKGQAIETKSLE